MRVRKLVTSVILFQVFLGIFLVTMLNFKDAAIRSST